MHAEVPELEGDFSLNATNTLSASLLLGKGLQRLAPTHDLNAAQLAALGRSLGPRRCAQAFSVLIAAHMLIGCDAVAMGFEQDISPFYHLQETLALRLQVHAVLLLQV